MKITIELDASEMSSILARALGILVAPVAPQIIEAPAPTIAQLDPAGNLEFVQKTNAPPTLQPQSGPVLPPATNGQHKTTPEQKASAVRVGADLAAKRVANGVGMEFEEFDALVKKEVKRLAVASQMPSHALWNEMRDPALPVLSSVMARYGANSAEELAVMLGYEPASRGRRSSAGEKTAEVEQVIA